MYGGGITQHHVGDVYSDHLSLVNNKRWTRHGSIHNLHHAVHSIHCYHFICRNLTRYNKRKLKITTKTKPFNAHLQLTRTSKIIKNVIEREENLLQNGILHVVFSQSSEIKLRSERVSAFTLTVNVGLSKFTAFNSLE